MKNTAVLTSFLNQIIVPYSILQGDCRDTLAQIADKTVQTCITSPPYYGLRNYGMADQIGLEQTPKQFVDELVAVFREVKRTLKDDGTCWLNIGDSYAGGGGGTYSTGTRNTSGQNITNVRNKSTWLSDVNLKTKDLIGIPWRLAFALQDDGWYLRQDIIWHKPNPMPESVTDRCTKAHEYIFLLSKSPKYYFDNEAIKEKAVGGQPGNKTHKHTADYEAGNELGRTKAGLVAYAERQRSKADSFKRDNSKRAEVIPGQTVGTHRPDREESAYDVDTRNKRSVWTVATKPFAEAHFATFPPELIRPCVLAGSRPGDMVLDPFSGAGTTGLVALENNRQYVGCELNPDYITLTHRRLAGLQPVLQFA